MWRCTSIASRQVRNARDCLQRNEAAVLVRYFSQDAGCNQCGLHGKEYGDSSRSIGGILIKAETANGGCKPEYVDMFKMSSPQKYMSPFSRLSCKISIPMTGMVSNSSFSCFHTARRRCYSSKSDLPPHQEIGMPSLSPTMTEGNIARWLKKEGDKVSPGEVLCEVETDKATVEMECMEEGYLAKIIKGDGAQNIKVGEIIAITVEEEDDIAKFKDYEASAPAVPSAPSQPKPPAEPTSPKTIEPEPLKAPEPKVSRPDVTLQAEERIFSSPLARKLAEDNNAPLSSIKGTGPDGRILKADVEDYLG